MDIVSKKINIWGSDYIVLSNGEIIGSHGNLLKQRKDKDGYMAVTVGNNQIRRSSVRVHRIVASAFLDNPDNLPEVNHKDFNRSNNSLENLEWVSHHDNVNHSFQAGHYSENKSGENNGRAKISWQTVREIRDSYRDMNNISCISKAYGIPYSTIFNIVHYKTWNS